MLLSWVDADASAGSRKKLIQTIAVCDKGWGNLSKEHLQVCGERFDLQIIKFKSCTSGLGCLSFDTFQVHFSEWSSDGNRQHTPWQNLQPRVLESENTLCNTLSHKDITPFGGSPKSIEKLHWFSRSLTKKVPAVQSRVAKMFANLAFPALSVAHFRLYQTSADRRKEMQNSHCFEIVIAILNHSRWATLEMDRNRTDVVQTKHDNILKLRYGESKQRCRRICEFMADLSAFQTMYLWAINKAKSPAPTSVSWTKSRALTTPNNSTKIAPGCSAFLECPAWTEAPRISLNMTSILFDLTGVELKETRKAVDPLILTMITFLIDRYPGKDCFFFNLQPHDLWADRLNSLSTWLFLISSKSASCSVE